jgi:hypothetical protein
LTNNLTIGATLLALGLGGIGTASAQPVYVGPRVYEPGLPPYEIVAIIRSAGLAPLTRPVRRGQDYVVIAGARNGGQMRVVVDAYEGDILRVTPVAAPQPYGAPSAYPYERQYEPRYEPRYDPRSRLAPIGPEIKDPPPGSYPRGAYGPSSRYDGVPPVPPRNVPNARLANAPPVATLPHPAVKPAHPPLPRSRPSVAASQTAPAQTAVAPPPAAAPVQQPQAAPTPPKESAPKTETQQLVPVAPLE